MRNATIKSVLNRERRVSVKVSPFGSRKLKVDLTAVAVIALPLRVRLCASGLHRRNERVERLHVCNFSRGTIPQA